MSLTAATKIHALANSAQSAQVVLKETKISRCLCLQSEWFVIGLPSSAATILQYTNVTCPIRAVHLGTDPKHYNSVSEVH